MMDVFGWFGKKREAPPAPPAPPAEKQISLEERVLRCVAEQVPGAVLEEEKLYFPNSGGLTMEVCFPELDGPQFRMEATLEHPDFFGPLVESTAWVVEGDQGKAQFAARQMVESVLDALLPALRGEGQQTAPVELWGRSRRFRASTSGLLLINDQEPPNRQDLWSVMERAVLDCLGTQKVYWVKLYLAHLSGGDTSCEVRINGWVVPELTKTLEEIAKNWPLDGKPIKSAKQYVVLVQEEDAACPYTWDQAKELTRQAIRLFEGGAKHDSIPDKLKRLSPDPSLAEDVFSFLPEQFTHTILSEVKTFSQFSLCAGEEEPVHIWFTQFRAWAPVYAAIQEHLAQDRPTREQMMSIVETSAMSHVLSNALNGGSKLEDLVLALVFSVSDHYQLW